MIIILIGNIGVGKSTIAQKILNQHKEADYVSIDDIRKKYGDGSEDKENHCKDIFIESINFNARIQVIELTGVGVLGLRLFELLSNYKLPILVFHLIVPFDNLLCRAKKKKWNIPFPLGVENIITAIRYTEDRFNEGLAEKLVGNCNNALLFSLINENKTMMNNNLKIIFEKIDYYLNKMNNV